MPLSSFLVSIPPPRPPQPHMSPPASLRQCLLAATKDSGSGKRQKRRDGHGAGPWATATNDGSPVGTRRQPVDFMLTHYLQAKTDSPATKKVKLTIAKQKAEAEVTRADTEGKRVNADAQRTQEMMGFIQELLESVGGARTKSDTEN